MGKHRLPGYVGQPRSGRAWRVVLCVAGKTHQFGARLEPLLKRDSPKNTVIEWAWRKLEELKKAAAREVAGLPGRTRFSELLRRYRAEELPDKARGTERTYEATLRPASRCAAIRSADSR